MNNKNSSLLSFRIVSCLAVILLSFTYMLNLNFQLDKVFESDTIEVCYETESDLSSDFEMDFLDDLVLKVVHVDFCSILTTDKTKQKLVDNQNVNPIHLDILIPPPRLKS